MIKEKDIERVVENDSLVFVKDGVACYAEMDGPLWSDLIRFMVYNYSTSGWHCEVLVFDKMTGQRKERLEDIIISDTLGRIIMSKSIKRTDFIKNTLKEL